MNDDTRSNMKPIITGYNPAATPGSEPILPNPLVAPRPSAIKINVQDGAAPVLPELAPRPMAMAASEPITAPAAPIPPAPTFRSMPPAPIQQFNTATLAPVPNVPSINQPSVPAGQTPEQLMQIQAKIDAHPLFAKSADSTAERTPKRGRKLAKLFIWIVIILVILAPAGIVAYKSGLVSR